MRRLLLLLLLVVPSWGQITWTKIFQAPPLDANGFGTTFGAYEDIYYDSFSGVTWFYTQDSGQNGNGIYSSRLHYINSGTGSHVVIGDNRQTTNGACISSSATWPYSHHTVGQIWIDPITHKLWTFNGTRSAFVAPEQWYYPITNPPATTCPGGDSGNTGCKWFPTFPVHLPIQTPTYGSGLTSGTTLTGGGAGVGTPLLNTDSQMYLNDPSGYKVGDLAKLVGSGEIVQIGAGGGLHCAPNPAGTNPLHITRNIALGAAPASSLATGGNVGNVNGLYDSGDTKYETDHNVAFHFGSPIGVGTPKAFMQLYADTNGTGTLSAPQIAAGAANADDWTDITAFSRCTDSECQLVVTPSSSCTGAAAPCNGKVPPGYYYPNLAWDPTNHWIITFAGRVGSGTLHNSLFTATLNESTHVWTWTKHNYTCSGADCSSACSCPMTSAPVFRGITAEKIRVAHAVVNGKLYYHGPSNYPGITFAPIQDWVWDPATEIFTELGTSSLLNAPQYLDSMTYDTGIGCLIAWGFSEEAPAGSGTPSYPGSGLGQIWKGCIPGGTAPSITTCGSGTGSVCPGGVLTTAYSQQVNATGSAPITFTITSGALPAGLSMSSTGLISGTPTATGVSTFTIQAANGTTPNASKQFTLTTVGPGTFSVALTVEEALYPGGTTGVARTNEPFCQGVPLAQGTVSNLSVLGLTGATAGQFRVLAYWPDNSFQWVEVCGIVASLAAGGTTTVTLTNGGLGNFGGGNLISGNTFNSTGGATACGSTGATCMTVPSAVGYNVLDSVTVDTTTVIASGASTGLVLMGPPATGTYPANVTCSPTSGGVPCTTLFASNATGNVAANCSILKNGPVEAIMKCLGDYMDASGNVYEHYTTYMHFYQGKNWIKIDHQLRDADFGASNTFATAFKGINASELRLVPSINTSAPVNWMMGIDSTTTGTGCSAGLCSGTITGSDSVYLYSAENQFMKPPNWCGSGCIAPSTDTGYVVVKNAAALAGPTADTKCPSGWADLSDANGLGITIGVYQMCASWPKSLEFNAGGTDVRIGVWPSENGAPTFGPGNGTHPHYTPWPGYETHPLYLSFHTSAPSSTTASNGFLSFQHPLIAKASVAYYNSTGAFAYTVLDSASEDTYYNNAQSTAVAPTGSATTVTAVTSTPQPVTFTVANPAGYQVGQTGLISNTVGTNCSALGTNSPWYIMAINGSQFQVRPGQANLQQAMSGFDLTGCNFTSATFSPFPNVPSTSATCQEATCDFGVSTTKWPLAYYRYWYWADGGGRNQSEFRYSYLFNWFSRNYTGRYLDAWHWYRFMADAGFARADGFTWRSQASGLNAYGAPSAASANCALGMGGCSHENWIYDSHAQEHQHWYGMPTAYFLMGDEVLKDAIINGAKDYFMNPNTYQAGQFLNRSCGGCINLTSGNPVAVCTGCSTATQFISDMVGSPIYVGTPTVLYTVTGFTDASHIILSPTPAVTSTFQPYSIWGGVANTRSVGAGLKGYAALHNFLTAIQDPDAATVLQVGQQDYLVQVAAPLCVSGYPVGCNFGPTYEPGTDTGDWRYEGTSLTRGVQMGGISTYATPWCEDGNAHVRYSEIFFMHNLIDGILQLRTESGPSWSEWWNSLDKAYGISQFTLTEGYPDDGSGRWDINNFRYVISLDVPNSCAGAPAPAIQVQDRHSIPQPNQTVEFNFLPSYLVEGATTFKGKFNMWLQRLMSTIGYNNSSPASDLGSFLPQQIINDINNPTANTLTNVPVTSALENGAGTGNYTLGWTVPAGIQTCTSNTQNFCGYRIKNAPDITHTITTWLGFDPINNVFTGDPVHNTPFFAAANAPILPTPGTPGTTQNFTYQTSPVVSGLSASNFSVRAYTNATILSVTAQALPQSTIGATYSQNITAWASGGSPPYSNWVIASGTLPTGLSLSLAGVISGTVSGATGTFTFTVRVTDSLSNTATSGSASIIINAAPIITTITPLPAGTVQVQYPAVTLAASGGTLPLSWAVIAGSLPNGLTMSSNGIITGTPLTSVAANFTVQVTDAVGITNSKVFALTIAGATVPPGTITGTGVANQYVFH